VPNSVADLAAGLAGRSTLAAEQRPADPSDPAWRAGLPKLPGDAMRDDLDRRLGPAAERARDLLRPLAFAQGQG